MFDPERLIAFAWVTALTSIVPGPSMMFIMGQAIWRGPRAGWAALAGMQIGYIVWWLAAALGLATLASAYPVAFKALAVAGVLYLAWLGGQAIRHSFHADEDEAGEPRRKLSTNAFRDGIAVAIGNPKSLIYVVAIIPPFVDPGRSIGGQIALLAVIALVIDLLIGWLYIGTGKQMARAMERAATRRWIDRGIGIVFILIAIAIAVDLYGTQL